MNIKTKRLLGVLLLLALVVTLVAPAALAEASTIHVSTPEDLKKLASDCRLDAYSRELTVILDNDIDLGGEPFAPIPSFSGTFKGNGHTIKGFVCASNGSHMGFFRYVEEEGIVTGLTVEGEVLPEDSRTDIGGLVGTNRGTLSGCSFNGTVSGLINIGGVVGENYGKLIDCSFSGKVSGKQFTGGIAGYSEGKLVRCTNTGAVNTEIVNETIDLEQLSLLDLTNLDLVRANDADVVSDTGGIAGMSKGTMTDCRNLGTVGYQHFGYNVGGVVGRQSGYMDRCVNYGTVLGRTDVGGIVGQMEPFLILTDRDTLADAIEDLTNSTNTALGNLSQNAREAGGTMNTLESQSNNLASDTKDMQAAKDKVDGNSKSDSSTSAGDVAEKGGEVAGNVGDAYNGMDQGTKDNIAGGNVSTDDVSNIVDAASGPVGDAKDNISDKIEQKKEQEAQDEQAYSNSKNTVTSDLNGMSRTIAALNKQLSKGTIQLSGDLTSVNYNFNRVMTLISNALTGDSILNLYEDVSRWDTEEEIDGKVHDCHNYAAVSGDDNVGGIAGNMGVENKYDMDGVIGEVIGGEGIYTNTYAARCIVRNCSNEGIITGKKCNVGGIVGLEKMGSVFNSENYGNAVSTNGNYVGGIAGYSYTYIENCYTICNLQGVEYVGGIAGFGTRVIDCVSLIGLSGDDIACTGTVCGWADVTLREVVYDDKGEETDEPGEYYIRGNMFVDNGMGAVDGISYAGRAEPVEYSAILEKEGIPETFSTLKLSFVADGVLVKELVFDYGGTINLAEIPEVPVKEGFTGYWKEYDYSVLCFSDTIEAVYVANQASLAVQDARNGSPLSILLLEGEFQDGASVMLEAYSGNLPELGKYETVLEAWTAVIEDNQAGSDSYSVRYYPPEVGKNKNVEIYVKDAAGAWSKAVIEQNGSYLVFNGAGSELSFVSVAVTDFTMYILVGSAAAFVLLGILLIILIGKARKRRKAKAEAAAAEQTEAEAAETPETEAPETTETETGETGENAEPAETAAEKTAAEKPEAAEEN